MKCLITLLVLAVPATLVANDSLTVRMLDKAEKISLPTLGNCYKLDANIYRCEQPTRQGMRELESLGVVSAVNLRNLRSDRGEVRVTGIIPLHSPINTWTISYDDILCGLKMLRDCPKPAAVHCLHGSDRTGCIVAAYRMVYCGWSREQALAEFTDPRYGYHAGWFPNIFSLLQSLDVEQLRADLQVGALPLRTSGR